MKPIVITSVDDDDNYIPFTLPSGVEVKILRMDYLDEDTFDAMNSELEALDVEQQIIAVANDIADSAVGAKLQWQPLLDGTKKRLVEAGVDIKRVSLKEGRVDEVSASSQKIVDAVSELADGKPLPLRKRGREIALTMLKHVVDEKSFAEFEKMRVGQLNTVLAEWKRHSAVSLGE